jgi:hypothetical protein
MNTNIPQHDFLTLGDLKSFNANVDGTVLNDNEPESDVNTNITYNPEQFNSCIVDPVEIDDDVMYQLSDIIDKKAQLDDRDYTEKSFKAPNTVDRLLNSEKIAYITEGIVPVAVATVVDATKENYMGIIPADFYALKSATNLEGRMHQEFFTVIDEKQDMGLSGELRKLLETEFPLMFITIPISDTDTLTGVANNGYKMVSEFDTDWEITPVQLWIN